MDLKSERLKGEAKMPALRRGATLKSYNRKTHAKTACVAPGKC